MSEMAGTTATKTESLSDAPGAFVVGKLAKGGCPSGTDEEIHGTGMGTGDGDIGWGSRVRGLSGPGG